VRGDHALTHAILATVENQLNLVRAATGTPEGKRATPRNHVRKKGRLSRTDQHLDDDNARRRTRASRLAQLPNRIETSFSEITDRMELARHGARTFWGLLTRTAATIAAHTLLRVCLTHD
jgi:hypothetical protein